MERLVEMGGAEGKTVCVRDQFQVIGRETSFVQCSANILIPKKKRHCNFFSPFLAVLRIRNRRIHMFLGHPDPKYGSVSGSSSGSGSYYNQEKIVRKTFISTVL
jgi:hypothetical protein